MAYRIAADLVVLCVPYEAHAAILDAIAEAYAAGVIDHRGVPRKDHPMVVQVDGMSACLLVPAAASGHGRDILMTRAEAPWKTFEDFIAEAKKNPGALTYGSAGPGTTFSTPAGKPASLRIRTT